MTVVLVTSLLILSLHYLVKCKSRSLAISNNKFILRSALVGSEIINSKATNTIGNYCISKSHTCHITSSLLQHVLKMSSSSTNASGRCWHYSLTTSPITCIKVARFYGPRCISLFTFMYKNTM